MPIMQLTTYLIFILVIGLGFTASHLEVFSDINSWDPVHLPVPLQAYFIVHIQIPTTITLITSSTLLPPSHNWGSTHLSILYIFTPISPFLISTSTEPQSSSLGLPVHFQLLKLSSTADFPSMWGSRRGDHALVCTNWCTMCREICCNVDLGDLLNVSVLPREAPSFFPFFFFLPDSTFSACSH